MTLSIDGTVLVIGAGKMAMAMIKGWLAEGLPSKNIILYHAAPSARTIAVAAEYDLQLVNEVPSLEPRLIMLSVKPQMFGDIYPIVQKAAGANTVLLSVAAGISLSAIEGETKSTRVVRAMPNTPSQVGKGVTGLVASAGATEADRTLATDLMRASGEVVWLNDEQDMDALTVVSGSGPAYVFYLVEAMAAAGVAEGLSADQAMRLARQTVIGAAALMEQDPTDAATLRQNVTSKAGVTAAALEVMMGEQGIGDVVKKALKAARIRSQELGK